MNPRLATILALLCLAAAPAGATPPQIVSVEDHLFARNDDTLFLLRSFTDNRGRHDVRQTDWLLIHRNIAVGDDRGFMGVARVIDRGPDAEGERVETIPMSHQANPFDLYEDFDAWPVASSRYPRGTIELDVNGLRFVADDDTRYFIGAEALKARIDDTLISSRGILPIDYIEGETDPFDPLTYDPPNDCTPDGVHRLNFVEIEPVLIRLDCADPETGQQARLWLLVPAVH